MQRKLLILVEISRIELLTSCMPCKASFIQNKELHANA